MHNIDIEGLVRPNIREMVPYSTARDDFKGKLGIFLDANESPYYSGWNRYPDPHQISLKEKIAAIKGVDTDNLFLGNGSDEAIDLVFRIFCVPGRDNVVAISPSYGMYTVSSQINDIRVRKVIINPDFSLPVDRILDACDSLTRVIFVCSPNNPTGNAFPKSEIMKLVEGFNGIVVVDEAYVDFSEGGSLVGEIKYHPNLIILQTMSKARAMAALRIGLAIADKYIVALMSNVKYPYNISEASQKAAIEQLELGIDSQVSEILSERKRVSESLQQRKVVKRVYPSDANFILIKVDNADRMYDFLTCKGIIVRNRTKMDLCENCLRVTIGLRCENDELLEAIDEYEKSAIY